MINKFVTKCQETRMSLKFPNSIGLSDLFNSLNISMTMLELFRKIADFFLNALMVFL